MQWLLYKQPFELCRYRAAIHELCYTIMQITNKICAGGYLYRLIRYISSQSFLTGNQIWYLSHCLLCPGDIARIIASYTEARVTKSEIIASEFADCTKISHNYLHHVLRIMDDKKIKKVLHHDKKDYCLVISPKI